MAKSTLQEYFDSSQDYRWEVVRSSLDFRKLLVRYDPVDSYDSSRRTQFKLMDIPPFDSAPNYNLINTIVEASAADVVMRWNIGLERDSDFTLRGFQGFKGRSTFPGLVFDSLPDDDEINPLRQALTTSTSTDGQGRTVVTISATALSDSDQVTMRESLIRGLPNIWDTLTDEGRIDSTLELFNIDSFGNLDPVEADFLRGTQIQFGDSISDTLQGMYGYNDSDWAQWLYDVP